MKLFLWAFVCAAILVGSWELYAHHKRHQMFAGTVYYPDGRPLQTTPSKAPASSATIPGTSGPLSTPAAHPGEQPASSQSREAASAPGPATPVKTLFSNLPPNGVAFAGIGNFEWYQEGSLTWRLNLQSGASCIAFATPEAWHKPLVYHHGCSKV